MLHLSDGTQRDTLRTPGHSPRCGDDLKDLADFFPVVKRLTHAHKDEVRERLTLWYGEDLVENLIGRELPVESLFASHAEVALHLTADLAGDAEGSTIMVWDIHRFDVLLCRGSEEVTYGTIFGEGGIRWVFITYGVFLCELLAIDLREIGHLVDSTYTLLVEPLSHLFGCKTRHV